MQIVESGSFETGSSTESELELGAAKADTPKRIFFSHLVFAAFRNGVSLREIALIASSALQDPRIATTEIKILIKTKSRERKNF